MLPAKEFECAGQFLHVDWVVAAGAALYLPAWQWLHSAVPLTSLCVPGAHAAHGPQFGPVNPSLQVQLSASALPCTEDELSGHARHVDSEVCPVAVEYLPGEHMLQ